MTATVRFEHISKRYQLGQSWMSLPRMVSNLFGRSKDREEESIDAQTLWALRDVSFALSPGHTLGLVGANGAGKSTVLKIIANITRPTSGCLEINGRVSALIELGAGFHPDLSGRDNVYLNGTILGLSRKEIKNRFDEIVDFSEIERFIDTPLKRYSSGMKVRLGFAVAACISPDILLVDEVLAVGDAAFRQKCLDRIRELRRNGTSIIFISHNLYLVKAVCDSAIYMKQGQVIFQGPTSEAIEIYERDIHEQRVQQFTRSQTEKVGQGTGVEIKQVDVLGPGGFVGEDGLHSRESAEIRIHYMAHEEMERANMVVRIIRSDSVTCCMMRTNLDDFSLTGLNGAGSVSLVIEPLQLIGGMYYVEVRITDASDSLILASGWSDWFYVKGEALSYQERSGVFEPLTSWSHADAGQLAY